MQSTFNYFGRMLVALLLAFTAANSACAQVGDGYADVVLDFFDSGDGPMAGPYGGTYPDGPGYVIPVSADVVLGGEPGPTGFQDFLSLPSGSYIVLGFDDETIIDGPGNDVSIAVPYGPQEAAEVYVSANAVDFTYLGTATQPPPSICDDDVCSSQGNLDLANIDFGQPVRAIKIVSLSSLGGSPGFDIFHVTVPPTSRTQPIPEPGAIALVLLGLVPLAVWRTRRVGCRLVLLVLSITTTNLAAAAEFIPLGFLPDYDTMMGYGLSGDGRTVVGTAYQWPNHDEPFPNYDTRQAFRWTEEFGLVSLDQVGFYRTGVGEQVSADGQTIIGSAFDASGGSFDFYYSDATGMRRLSAVTGLPDVAGASNRFAPRDMSFDGSIIAGQLNDRAVLWSAGGTTELDLLPGFEYAGTRLLITPDGTTVVGATEGASARSYFRWTEGSGTVSLSVPGRLQPNGFDLRRMSNDGRVLGGETNANSEDVFVEATRWTEESGLVGLGFLPDTERRDGRKQSTVTGMSGDGNVVVGYSGEGYLNNTIFTTNARAYLWTESLGMQDLQQHVIDNYGLGDVLTGWELKFALEVSSNGENILGVGLNPDGMLESWVIRFDTQPIPEPATAALALLVFAPLAVWRTRRTVL